LLTIAKYFPFSKSFSDDKTVLGSCKLVIARNVRNHSEEEEEKKKKKKKEKKSAVHMTFSRGSRTSGHYALSWP